MTFPPFPYRDMFVCKPSRQIHQSESRSITCLSTSPPRSCGSALATSGSSLLLGPSLSNLSIVSNTSPPPLPRASHPSFRFPPVPPSKHFFLAAAIHPTPSLAYRLCTSSIRASQTRGGTPASPSLYPDRPSSMMRRRRSNARVAEGRGKGWSVDSLRMGAMKGWTAWGFSGSIRSDAGM